MIFKTIKQLIDNDDQTPVVGEIYRMKDENPWEPIKVRVTGIKDGWVRYLFLPGVNPQYKEVDRFIRIYEVST